MRKNICYCLFVALLCFAFSCKKKTEDHTFVPASNGTYITGPDTISISVADTIKLAKNTAIKVPAIIFCTRMGIQIRISVSGIPAGISVTSLDTMIKYDWNDTLLISFRADTTAISGAFPIRVQASSNDYVGPGSKVFDLVVQ